MNRRQSVCKDRQVLWSSDPSCVGWPDESPPSDFRRGVTWLCYRSDGLRRPERVTTDIAEQRHHPLLQHRHPGDAPAAAAAARYLTCPRARARSLKVIISPGLISCQRRVLDDDTSITVCDRVCNKLGALLWQRTASLGARWLNPDEARPPGGRPRRWEVLDNRFCRANSDNACHEKHFTEPCQRRWKANSDGGNSAVRWAVGGSGCGAAATPPTTLRAPVTSATTSSGGYTGAPCESRHRLIGKRLESVTNSGVYLEII